MTGKANKLVAANEESYLRKPHASTPRRERIATAIFAGILSNPAKASNPRSHATAANAVRYADMLIEELDRTQG